MGLFACCHADGSPQVKAQISLKERSGLSHTGVFPINVAVETLWIMLTIANYNQRICSFDKHDHIDGASCPQLEENTKTSALLTLCYNLACRLQHKIGIDTRVFKNRNQNLYTF